MSDRPPPEITQLLLSWRNGNEQALEELMPVVYSELRRMARNFMRRQNPGHTLQTTALVNEAYLRLVDSNRVNWQDRNHFFAISAQLMRRILVDFARKKNSLKRGGGQVQVTLDAAGLGHHREGVPAFVHELDHGTGQPQLALHRLVGIRVGADRDRFGFVAGLGQLAFEISDPCLFGILGDDVRQTGIGEMQVLCRNPVFV